MIGKVIVMETFVKQTLLYDFYGELLTDRQKQIYESVVLEDQSLREASEEFGISRQGVHDMIKRCTAILEDYEDKLHLVERFLKIQKEVGRIRELACSSSFAEAEAAAVTKICDRILSELCHRVFTWHLIAYLINYRIYSRTCAAKAGLPKRMSNYP